MEPANGAFDSDARNNLGIGAGQCKVGGEASVTGGNRHQSARAVNQRGHSGSGDPDCRLSRDLQIPGNAACVNLVGTGGAVSNRDIVCDIYVGAAGGKWRRLSPHRQGRRFNPGEQRHARP
jgi:hypothetical protein